MWNEILHRCMNEIERCVTNVRNETNSDECGFGFNKNSGLRNWEIEGQT